ncbi:MAG: hypothetical protein V4735_02720 [Pseudomonadota bacterium]
MTDNFESPSAKHSESIARNWDMLSVGSFGAAIIVGLVKTANDVRHKFYQAFVVGYPGRETICTDILQTTEAKFKANETQLIKGEIAPAAYFDKMHSLAKERKGLVATRLKEGLGIESEGLWSGWIKGTAQRLNRLGTTNRMDAAMGFAGTATIALGAIAVLKHSSRVLDAINQKIADQEKGRTP